MAEAQTATDPAARTALRPLAIIFLGGLVAVAVGYAAVRHFAVPADGGGGSLATFAVQPPLDPQRAIENIEKLCDFGPRPSGSRGMQQQQEFLRARFRELGGAVRWQDFTERHPVTGETVQLRNMIVGFGPASGERVLVCAHYDTRPFPDLDPRKPKGRFVGANDGASGVALLLELAHAFKAEPPPIGVDLILFDGEEFVFDADDEYFLGSSYFARDYRASQDGPKYRAGVLVDMIGDKHLEILYEVFSYKLARQVTERLWQIADERNIDAFVPRLGYELRDDHLPLNQIAGIPTCDIIDFDYPSRGRRAINYWHTTEDTPDKCSGKSVCAVASVVLQWVREQKPAP